MKYRMFAAIGALAVGGFLCSAYAEDTALATTRSVPLPPARPADISVQVWRSWVVSPDGKTFHPTPPEKMIRDAYIAASDACKGIELCTAITVKADTVVVGVHCKADENEGSFLGESEYGSSAVADAMKQAQTAGFDKDDCAQIGLKIE